MKNIITILLVVGILVLSGYILNIGKTPQNIQGENIVKVDDKIKTDENIPEEKPPIKNNGLKIGETYDYGTVSIKPLLIEEDSRCPIDVTCIQAGTVKLKIEVISKVGNSNNNIHVVTLGVAKVIHGVNVVLSSVNPVANSKINLSPGDYGFTFDVTKKTDPVTPPEPVAKCYVGGCSSEVCSDRDDVATNCMYREEFACYQTAKCERQSTGKCGWTETNELKVCLQNSRPE
ncbi:MAG: hypothetical protein WC087_02790 [Candidatus Paceibacterota bacterium]